MKHWTTKEISYIQKHALLAETNEVLNIDQMAKKLGRTVSSVSKKIYEFRLNGSLPKVRRELAFDSKGRPWTPEEEKRLIAMYKQGNTYAEIAEALGRSEASCSTKSSKLQSKGKLTSKRVERWTGEDVQTIIDAIEFDQNGYVSNYPELARVTGKQYSQVVQKVGRLRKEGRITTTAQPGTTSVKAKKSMQKFNDARFAQYKKKEETPMQLESVKHPVSIESREERVIHTVVIFAELETHTYFSADGTKIAEIQKEPTTAATDVSQKNKSQFKESVTQ